MNIEQFIYELMYERKEFNIEDSIKELMKRTSKLTHIEISVPNIDSKNKKVYLDIMIDKINIGFSKVYYFEQFRDLEKIIEELKTSFKSIILMYYNLK